MVICILTSVQLVVLFQFMTCAPPRDLLSTKSWPRQMLAELSCSPNVSHKQTDMDRIYKNKRPALVFSQTTQKIQIKILTSNKLRKTRTTSKGQVVSAALFSRRTPDTWSKLVHIAKVQHKRMGSAGWHVVISEDTQTEFLPSLP